MMTFGKKQAHLTYFDRPGAYLICIHKNHLVCAQTPKGYFLLGGGIEGTETQEQCLRRECLEEVGYSINIHAPLCAADTYCIHPRIGPFHPIQYYFRGTLGEKVQEPIEPDHALVWLPLDQIQEMYVPQQIWAVQYAIQQE